MCGTDREGTREREITFWLLVESGKTLYSQGRFCKEFLTLYSQGRRMIFIIRLLVESGKTLYSQGRSVKSSRPCIHRAGE